MQRCPSKQMEKTRYLRGGNYSARLLRLLSSQKPSGSSSYYENRTSKEYCHTSKSVKRKAHKRVPVGHHTNGYQLVMATHAHANLSCAWARHNLKYQHLRLSWPASTGPSAPMGPAHSIPTSHISWLDRALATKCGRHRQARCSSGRWLQQSSVSDSLPPE